VGRKEGSAGNRTTFDVVKGWMTVSRLVSEQRISYIFLVQKKVWNVRVRGEGERGKQKRCKF